MSIIAALPPAISVPLSAPPVSDAPSVPDVTTNAADQAVTAPATNATDITPSVYTALANVSAPTIRGTNINTAS